MMRSLARGVVVWLLLAPGLLRAAPPVPRIVNGTPTADYPAVAAVLVGDENNQITCSGVLVGCQTVLTAAHCVCPDAQAPCQGAAAPDPFLVNVYFEHAGFFPVDEVIVHPSYAFPTADVAVITLLFPVSGIAPAPIGAGIVPVGTAGTIVGYGTTGGTDTATGIKRKGSVTTSACMAGISEETSVCWAFTGEGANTCAGDSGGPLFLDTGEVIGLTSGGVQPTCFPDDASWDTRLSTYLAWIATQGGEDLSQATCDVGPPIGQPGTTVTTFLGLVSSGNQPVHRIEVPEGTEELRFGFHSADTGSNDFDYYVRFGEPPTVDDWDCADEGPSQYGYCETFLPDPGTWFIWVRRVKGSGGYQVTVSTRTGTGALSECGNGVMEIGEECDGADAAACAAGCDFDCRCVICTNGALDVTDVLLSKRFMLRAFLRNDDGTYDGLDPRTGNVIINLHDADGHAATVTIPPDDPGWKRSRPRFGLYVWHGKLGGLRRLVLRDRTKKSRAWYVQADGRGVPGLEQVTVDGLMVTVRTDYTCAAKQY